MKQRNVFTLFTVITLLIACTKESEKKYCCQGFDPSGYDISGLLLCDKAEVNADYPMYSFYKQGERKCCWQTATPRGDTFYTRHIPQSMADKMRSNGGNIFTKVDCNSFCV